MLGDALGANVLLMGYAWQKGLIPLQRASIEKAIELNGVAIPFNMKAFKLGRLLAHRPDVVTKMVNDAARADGRAAGYQRSTRSSRAVSPISPPIKMPPMPQRFRIALSSAPALEGGDEFGEAVARSYYKMLAYKDEYEVARLYSDGRFKAAFAAQFDGGERPRVQLAPPLISGIDPATGRPKKRSFGPWIFTAFGVLARLKGLRGGAFDVFGYTAERKGERADIMAYEATVDRLLAGLTADNRGLALAIARLPMDVRGFGPVKDKAREDVARRAEALWAKWPGIERRAAA